MMLSAKRYLKTISLYPKRLEYLLSDEDPATKPIQPDALPALGAVVQPQGHRHANRHVAPSERQYAAHFVAWRARLALMDDKQYDLSQATFEEFVTFLFDHEVMSLPPAGSVGPEPWYWHADVTFDPMRMASLYIRLFTQPRFLLQQFSLAQLEQGFWAVQSPTLECAVTEIIWDQRLPFELRERCVRSMFHLYELLFSDTPLETSSEMWWDSLAYDWHCGIRARANGGEDLLMQDVIFETLGKILQLPSGTSQAAALHGLGHLHHPDTNTLIVAYLAQHPEISDDLREYAQAAARFEVL
ncbi:MAG: hypothetical protein ACK4KV_21380 [Rhodocyclaceae bacterium]